MKRYRLADKDSKTPYGASFLTKEGAEKQRLTSYSPKSERIIIIEEDLELLHYENNLYSHWGYWSDGKVTSLYGELENSPKSLSEAAIGIISCLKGADGAEIFIEGGYSALAEIDSIVSEQDIIKNSTRPGGYAGHKITKYLVKLKSGELTAFYARSVGYSEGYQFDIYPTLKAAKEGYEVVTKWSMGWRDTECLECGAIYDAPGHVEPGSMGCDRCGK